MFVRAGMLTLTAPLLCTPLSSWSLLTADCRLPNCFAR